MVAKLLTDVLRRFALVWTLGFVLLTFLWLPAAFDTGAAPDGPDPQRAEYLTTLGKTMLGMFLPLLAGQAVAFGALNKRVVQMLPVSRRDIWRAKWMLATLGAATLTTAAQALTMVISRAAAPAASDAFTHLVVTWLSTFILGGGLMATWIWAPRLPCAPRLLATTGVLRNLLTLVVWFLRAELRAFVWLVLAVAFIMGAIRLPGLLLRYVTMDWHGLSVWHGLAAVLPLLVAIASYWHRPPVHTRAGRPRETGETGLSWWGTLIPRGALSAIRLLVFENVVSASLNAAVTLGVVGVVGVAVLTIARHQPFGEAIAGIASWFGYQLQSTKWDGGAPLLFGALVGGSAGRFNARHLRALPISTLQLTALLLLPALLLWLAVITLVSGLHLAVIGTMPRIDASLLALVMGITALCQPLRLQVRRPNRWLFVLLLIILVPGDLIQRRLPDALAPLAPITFGLLLTAIAITWSYWLLTRSSTPFGASFWTASIEP